MYFFTFLKSERLDKIINLNYYQMRLKGEINDY